MKPEKAFGILTAFVVLLNVAWISFVVFIIIALLKHFNII